MIGPWSKKKEIIFEEALKIAIEERPEMAMNQKEIENSSIDEGYFRNQLLPQLDLNVSVWYPGQSGDILIYRNNNPYTGDIIGKIEGSRVDSLRDIFKFKYSNWTVSFNLNIPLENLFSRASLAKARMEKEQKLLEKKRLEKSIYFEILDIFKVLENNEKRIDTTSRYRELMERKLEAEEQKYKLGLVGSEWLFQYQRDLASAKAEEINAIIDYKISVANLEKILGINLKTKNIKFRSYEF